MIKNILSKKISNFKRKPTKKKILNFVALNIFFSITLITSIAFASFGFLDVATYIKEGGNIADTYFYSVFNAIFVIGAGTTIPAIIGTTKTIKEYKKELKKSSKQKKRQKEIKSKITQKQQISTYTPKRETMSIEERRKRLKEIRQQLLSMEIEDTYEEELEKNKSKTKEKKW